MPVKVEGLRDVVRGLEALGVEVVDLKGAFGAIALEGAQLVARYTPRLTGRLAASARGNRAKSVATITAGRASVPYAGPINYGWRARNIAPAGFMAKADHDMQPIALERLEDEVDHIIRQKGLN